MTATHSAEDAFYDAARCLADPEARAAFLYAACAGDPAMRERLERMLHAAPEADDFFRRNGVDVNRLPPLFAEAPTGVTPPAEQPGEMIGPYRLREGIGEGGFGTVWVADQESPVRRRVALKIIKLGMDTKEVIARFEQERQALAMMDHPNIARVLDAGATQSGRPFFVMELVRGTKITDYCDDQQLPTAERIGLFITVCQAVQHAHQKGIIHRDLKPSNILVTVNDGVAVPKIIDFGVAKATQGRLSEHSIYTQFQQMVGTPLYMSPEQAEMTSLDIDTRSDIYSLGVLLYELLTGRTPIDQNTLRQAGLDEMRRIIREVDPPRPSARVQTLAGQELTTTAKRRHTEPAKLHGALRGDLDWIVMKCIEKDRRRRYDTATGIALDLQRHLANEVVAARPPTTGYLLGKLIRRHRLAFAAGAAILASLLLGFAGATWMYYREKEARKQTAAERDAKELARKEAENISKFLSEVFQSPDPARDGRAITVAETLDRAAQKLDSDLTAQPAQRAKLQAALGHTYDSLGLYRDAIPMQEKARDYYLATFGPEHPDTLAAMTALATSCMAAGRREEALKLREEVLARSRTLYGPEHANTLAATTTTALSYHAAGRDGDALKVQEQALELSRSVHGPEHPDTLRAMTNLALAYHGAGRHDEALTLGREVLALSVKVLGREHPATLGAITNLALFYTAASRKDEALKLREEVLSLSRKINGPEHPATINAMNDLATSYAAAGRKDEAMKLREEVLALRRKVLGPEHPDTLEAMTNLAISYGKAGRLADAVVLQEPSLAIARRVLKPNHPVLVAALNHLAELYEQTGRKEEAAKLRQESGGKAAPAAPSAPSSPKQGPTQR